jgi:hypothetical protein
LGKEHAGDVQVLADPEGKAQLLREDGEGEAVTRFEDLDLYRWWEPAELAQALGPDEHPEDDRIIADYRYQKHLEAWIAAHFGVAYSKLSGVRTLVKMVAEKERFPDAAIRLAGDRPLDVGIQITAVMEPGRILGAEYRERIKAGNFGGPRPYRIPDPKEIAAWVDAGLAGKVLTADRRTWLVIYLNIWAETAEFAMHVERERLESWGAVYVLSSAGNAVLSLKGEGTERWQNFEL